MLARVQAGAKRRSAPAAPYGRPLGSFLDNLGGSIGAAPHKWRDGMLLLTYGAWFSQEPRQPTWLTEKALRRSLAKPAGMSFLEVAELAAGLTDAQAEIIAEDHPCLSVLKARACMASFSGTNGLRLRSPGGIPITDELLPLLPVQPGESEVGAGSAVRVVERDTELQWAEGGTPRFVKGDGGMWWWEYLGADGNWRAKCGYNRPREAPERREDL